MGTVTVGDVDVAYAVEGSGEPVVLVHGTTSSTQGSWLQVTPVLAERFTVIGPDLPGSGGSSMTGKPLELDDIVDQTLAAATDAGADRFHLAGWSLGAVVAAAAAGPGPRPGPHAGARLRVGAHRPSGSASRSTCGAASSRRITSCSPGSLSPRA